MGGFNEQGVDSALRACSATRLPRRSSRWTVIPARGDPKKVIAAAQEATKLPGASTMFIECDGTKIKAANLGDSGFRVVRNGEVVFASPAHITQLPVPARSVIVRGHRHRQLSQTFEFAAARTSPPHRRLRQRLRR